MTATDQVPPASYDFVIVTRSRDNEDDSESFVAKLRDILGRIVRQTGVARLAEPRRLFEIEEYRTPQ